jgi:hypothetical protein
MNRRYSGILILWSALGLLPQVVLAADRLEARLVDDETGRPVAARVACVSPDGRFVEIDGQHQHVASLGKRWCYVDGSFTLSLPANGMTIEIRRGLETAPLVATVESSRTEETVSRTYRLRRWTDMRGKGWVSGDIHAHVPTPEEAHLQMRAEDLNVLNLLAGENFRANPYFTGKLDKRSTTACEIYVGQEVRDWQMGHLTLLGLSRMIPGYPHVGGKLESWRRPHWLMARAMRAAHEQGALVVWSHFSNLPGAESPIGVALGLVDALELMTYDDPTQLPSHWSPWKNSGMSQAEFTVMRGVDLYYQYLNSGFRLPIASGTDKMADDIPLGSNRTYIPTPSQPDYAAWLAGVKVGRGFVTNGPLLEFAVEGAVPGEVVQFQDRKKVFARVKARSILPFTTLEIVLNGETVGHKTVFVEDNPPVDGVYSMEVETNVELGRSSWLAARVAEDPDIKNRILPRGLSVFAHTNPVFFYKDGRKVRETASIGYLRKYVQGVIHWLETKPDFTDPAEREEALRLAREALGFYEGL